MYKVGIFFGGESCEHDISVITALQVLENIDKETFDNERFNNIANEEFDNIFSSINEQEFKSLLETST